MKQILLIICAVVLLVGCQSRENQALVKKSSSGKTCEVLLACDKGVYYGETKALIDSILREPQPGLPQPEPRFSVVNVPVSSLHNTQMFQMHRNIILCDVASGNPNKLYISRDKWASPQVVVDVAASSDSALRSLLRRHELTIKREIYRAEHQRIINAFYNTRNVELMQRFRNKFGFEMTFSEDFRWASEDGDFAWVRKETKDFSLGILVQTIPYRSEDMLTPEKIDNRLDTMMRRHVPAPAPESYMATERRLEIEHHRVDYEGTDFCIETRGLLSPDHKQLVEVVGYVYCPRFDKRDYLMQVEGICNSVRWKE